MEGKEKLIYINKLGLTIQALIKENKLRHKDAGISSLRKLAAASGVEYAIIQKISSGQKDPQFTTIVAIAEGFGISLAKLMSYFENLPDQVVTNKNTSITRKGKKKK